MDKAIETLLSAGMALATALRAGERAYHTYAEHFRLSLLRHDSLDAWQSEYSEAWEALKERRKTPTERKALKAAVEDWEDMSRSNTAFHAWNDAQAADKVTTRMKVYKSHVAKVAARLADRMGDGADVLKDGMDADAWQTLRDHFAQFPNMDRAKIWGEHGGDPANPQKPGKGPEHPSGPDGDDEESEPLAKDDAEIVETVRVRYDDTAATAVENVLRSAAERKRIRERDAEKEAAE